MLFYLLSGLCFLVALIIFLIRRGNRNVTVEGGSNGIIITGDNASDVQQINTHPADTKPPSLSSWQWIERGILVVGVLIPLFAYFFPRSG